MHLHWVCIGAVAAACPLCTVHAGAEERKKIQFPDDSIVTSIDLCSGSGVSAVSPLLGPV